MVAIGYNTKEDEMKKLRRVPMSRIKDVPISTSLLTVIVGTSPYVELGGSVIFNAEGMQ